jgi:RHS repeat-associated protein
LHFYLDDPLGTRRAQTNSSGTLEATYQSLPFGDDLVSTGSDDPTENHFTGKERDTESGNDYFGARYYASSVGRWLSPDSNDVPEPVPYANFLNPQTLNLYAYVGNNPLSKFDDDGHDGCTADGMEISCNEVNSEAFVQCPNNACSGVQWDYKTINGNTQFMGGALTQFQSSTDGSSGYIMSGLTDAQLGTLTANIQYDKAVTDYMAYMSKIGQSVTRSQAEQNISREGAHMEGGHWNFPYAGPDPRSGTDNKEFRFPDSTLHIPKADPLNPGTYIHDDTFSPAPIWQVWNLALHGLVDYAGGHTLFQGGFTF